MEPSDSYKLHGELLFMFLKKEIAKMESVSFCFA